ncbi:hypothetical protein ACQ4PT_030728 [Festuca glaucescens]
MDPPTRSSERTSFKDLSNTINTSVTDNSNGGEPTDAKERNRQRVRRRYAEMDKDKKDEMLRKRRESYQQKKAKLQCTPFVACTSESRGGPSALSQLQIMPAVKGAIWQHLKKFLCFMLRPPYKLFYIPYIFCCVETVDGPTSISIQTTPLCPNKLRRQQSREQNAEMDSKKREESLKREHQIEAKRARERLRYADMTPTQKRSKKALRDERRNSLSKESIAMENPCWTPEPVFHTPGPQGSIPTCDWHIPDFSGTPIYIEPTTEQMSGEVTPNMDISNISRRKHVTPGERHALVSLRNETFYANCKKHVVASADDNPSITMEDGTETPTQTTIIHYETTPPATPMPEIVQKHQTQLPANDDGEDEGVILEEDSEDEEGYMFAGQEDDADEDVQTDEVNDSSASVPNVSDPYDMVYNKIPTETHILKSVDNCVHKHCGAKRFEHEPPGFCCRNGQIKLANTVTPPELERLWTSEDPDARHFRDNIRFFNGHFSFTSLYCNLDGDTTNTSKHPIYTFRAHGQMYHNIRSFGRIDGLQGSHLELYFFDDDPNLEHRYRSCRKEQCAKDKEVITQMVNILRENPYSEHLRSMGQVEDVDDYRITLNLDQRMDQRRYNAPTTSEVAAVWVEGSERRRQFDHSVILQGKNRDIFGIKSYHGCYDALSYPLFFPKGELGWHTDIPKENVSYDTVMAARAARLARRNNDESSQSPGDNNDNGDEDNDPASGGNKCVSVRDYYCYKFQMRPGIFNPILHGKRLFQQFAVDTYIKIENSRLDYMWNHQDKIRADLYQGLMDSLHAGEGSADAIGKRTVLSTSFIGGPRDKRRRYMDAMALVRKYGKPDIFLTMTCNPNWDEIKRELYPGQTPQDRPDIVVRVFRAKLEELKNKLLHKDILGKVKAYVYVVEFQKRGLPHAHFLLIMEGRFKLTCPEQYDKLISAELPNKIKYPELYKMVVKHMMHGPCGVLNPDCPCTKGRPACKNQYPRPFNAATLQGKDSYPLYRRRNDGSKVMVRKELLDNRWVVPYNPHLLRHFNCHINVEACSSIKAVKYLFKYIYKGHDRASITVSEADKADGNGNIDEINQYRDARWVTPPEALWRIYGFELSKNHPPVMQLQLHLENCHMVSFKQGQDIQQVVNRQGVEKSMLTEYFAANKLHEEARGILYRDFPEWYTWQKGKKGQDKHWQRRAVKKMVHLRKGYRLEGLYRLTQRKGIAITCESF